ncbi:dockerin type I repeat-containing protein [Acetivibrio mesophilus]|uniref:Dockerin n=1 Tax=Acetivibrio mesophilus TaxID=2487273 RepID=A0A4Q0I4Y0_9FIRM|nr:dockerin type I repeat-containing protein [Acetivibrio mesophilus]ODM27295.1 dockerin [Clostridium sp. Bc-iso-3]RXE58867.1 dockerin [Acetivibrio mesophilus]HHV29537.1 dockerin [Clostridium sp.]
MKKRIALLTVVLSIAMVVFGGAMTAYAGHQCSTTVLIGDVDLDGSIDSLDLALLYAEINNTQPFTNQLQYIAADVNYDGAVTMLDAYLIRDYILRAISSFPAGATYTVYYGDVNGDQLVTEEDLRIVKDYILLKTTLTFRQYVAADVDGDGLVDSLDASYINSYVKGKRDHFPVCP